MKLNLKLEYATEEEDEAAKVGGTTISLNLIRRAIDQKYPANGSGGVKEEDQVRTMSRIQKALVRAKNAKSDELDVTVEQLETIHGLLKNLRETGGVAGGFAHHFYDLLEHVETSVKAAKEAAKTVQPKA